MSADALAASIPSGPADALRVCNVFTSGAMRFSLNKLLPAKRAAEALTSSVEPVALPSRHLRPPPPAPSPPRPPPHPLASHQLGLTLQPQQQSLDEPRQHCGDLQTRAKSVTGHSDHETAELRVRGEACGGGGARFWDAVGAGLIAWMGRFLWGELWKLGGVRYLENSSTHACTLDLRLGDGCGLSGWAWMRGWGSVSGDLGAWGGGGGGQTWMSTA